MTYPTMEMYEALHAEKAKLRAEIEQLTEQLHYANGTCDLAMKHRDEAEAEIEQQRQLLRAARGLLQHHNILYPDEIDDAIPRWPDSEIALLRAEIERLRTACDCHPNSICANNKKLRAEIERLTTVHDDYVVAANANVCALYREIDRLKAKK